MNLNVGLLVGCYAHRNGALLADLWSAGAMVKAR